MLIACIKNCAYVFLIFFNCYLRNISEILYSIFMIFGPTNKMLLVFIEKKTKNIEFEIFRMI